MQDAKEAALTTLREFRDGKEPDPERMTQAVRWALDALDFAKEGVQVEDFNGQLTVVVQLSEGVKLPHPDGGGVTFCDVVRLRVPVIEDEWHRDQALAELGINPERSPGIAELAMVHRLVVDWKGLPMPRLREHLMTLNRYDSGRLVQAYLALEDHAERLAMEKKASRRARSS